MTRLRPAVKHLLGRCARLTSRRFETVDLDKRTIVFAPHPDDETLGCGGTIARMTDRKTEVHIVFITDGCASRGGRFPTEELAALRREEAIEASTRLGVPSERLHFVNAPDGALQNKRSSAQRAIRDIFEQHRPEQLFAPYFREPPSDHWVTFEIVKAAADERSGRLPLYGYPIWFWNRWPFVSRSLPLDRHSLKRELSDAVRGAQWLLLELTHRVDITGTLERKQHALSAHRTQVARLDESANQMTLSDVGDGTWLENMMCNEELFSLTWVGS